MSFEDFGVTGFNVINNPSLSSSFDPYSGIDLQDSVISSSICTKIQYRRSATDLEYFDADGHYVNGGNIPLVFECDTDFSLTSTVGSNQIPDPSLNMEYQSTNDYYHYWLTDIRAVCGDGSTAMIATIHQPYTNVKYPGNFIYLSGIEACKNKIGKSKNLLKVNNDGRQALGLFYFDEDNPDPSSFRPNIPEFTSYYPTNLLENGDGKFVKTFIDQYTDTGDERLWAFDEQGFQTNTNNLQGAKSDDVRNLFLPEYWSYNNSRGYNTHKGTPIWTWFTETDWHAMPFGFATIGEGENRLEGGIQYLQVDSGLTDATEHAVDGSHIINAFHIRVPVEVGELHEGHFPKQVPIDAVDADGNAASLAIDDTVFITDTGLTPYNGAFDGFHTVWNRFEYDAGQGIPYYHMLLLPGQDCSTYTENIWGGSWENACTQLGGKYGCVPNTVTSHKDQWNQCVCTNQTNVDAGAGVFNLPVEVHYHHHESTNTEWAKSYLMVRMPKVCTDDGSDCTKDYFDVETTAGRDNWIKFNNIFYGVDGVDENGDIVCPMSSQGTVSPVWSDTPFCDVEGAVYQDPVTQLSNVTPQNDAYTANMNSEIYFKVFYGVPMMTMPPYWPSVMWYADAFGEMLYVVQVAFIKDKNGIVKPDEEQSWEMFTSNFPGNNIPNNVWYHYPESWEVNASEGNISDNGGFVSEDKDMTIGIYRQSEDLGLVELETATCFTEPWTPGGFPDGHDLKQLEVGTWIATGSVWDIYNTPSTPLITTQPHEDRKFWEQETEYDIGNQFGNTPWEEPFMYAGWESAIYPFIQSSNKNWNYHDNQGGGYTYDHNFDFNVNTGSLDGQYARWVISDECLSHDRCLQMSASEGYWTHDQMSSFSNYKPYYEETTNDDSEVTNPAEDEFTLILDAKNQPYTKLNQITKVIGEDKASVLLTPYSSLKVSFWMKTKRDNWRDDISEFPEIEVGVDTNCNAGHFTSWGISDSNDDGVRDDWYPSNQCLYNPQGRYNNSQDNHWFAGGRGRFRNNAINTWEKKEYTFHLDWMHRGHFANNGGVATDFSVIQTMYMYVQYSNIAYGNVYLDNFEVKESHEFIPDVDVRTRLSSNNFGASLTEYYDPNLEIHKDIYFSTQAPLEAQFYFYPRYQSDRMFMYENNDRYWNKWAEIPYDFFANGMFYLYDVDWGDDSPREFTQEPKQLGLNVSINHSYKKSGIYEIKGTMFRTKPGKTEDTNVIDWDTRAGIIHHKNFRLYINVNEGYDEDFTFFGSEEGFNFIPYKNSTAVIGGVSDNSFYSKSIKRQLGFITDDIKTDIPFETLGDKLKTEIALTKFNSDLESQLDVLPFYTTPRYNRDGTKIFESINVYRDELSKNINNLDLTNMRYFNRPSSMIEMLGFGAGYDYENILEENVGIVGLWSDWMVSLGAGPFDEYNVFPDDFTSDNYFPLVPALSTEACARVFGGDGHWQNGDYAFTQPVGTAIDEEGREWRTYDCIKTIFVFGNNPGNPANETYWQNIIPKGYSIFNRTGLDFNPVPYYNTYSWFLSTLQFPNCFEEFDFDGNDEMNILDMNQWTSVGRPDIADYFSQNLPDFNPPYCNTNDGVEARPISTFFNPLYQMVNRGPYTMQHWFDDYYYPVLPKYNKYGRFTDPPLYPGAQEEGSGFLFPLDGPITNEDYTDLSLKISLINEDIDNNVLIDKSGNSNYGFTISDYNPNFEEKTSKPGTNKYFEPIIRKKQDGPF